MTYSYDPKNIKKHGKDQMRFELGDTQVAGEADTCALCDEEYEAMLEGVSTNRRAWLIAKLAIVEAILLKLSYQVNTKVDVLSYALGDRAEHWKDLYEMLKDEIKANTGVPTMDDQASRKPPYFTTSMNDNARTITAGNFPYRPPLS